MQKLTTVLIVCNYAFECKAWVEFRATKHGFSIWAGGEDESNAKRCQRVSSIKEPYSWRAAARGLLSLAEGAMYGDYRSDTYVNGESGFRADILAICWMREDGISDEAKSFFIGISEESLTKLENHFGSIISDEALNLFGRYVAISWDDPFECWDNNFPINSQFNFEELVNNLENKSELDKEEKLLPYKAELAKIYELISEHHAIKSNSYASGISRGMQNAELRVNLEDFVLKYERLPLDNEVKSIFKKVKE